MPHLVLALLGARAALTVAVSLRTHTPVSKALSNSSFVSQGSITKDCAQQMEALKGKQAEAKTCEEKNKFDDQVLTHLKAAKPADAVKVTQQAFEKCGGLSKGCAEKVSPQVVTKLRLTGVALSENCRTTVNTARQNKTRMVSVRKCEAKEKMANKLFSALKLRDIDGAVQAVDSGLQKCLKLSDECSFQAAPVLVNQILTMSAMKAKGIMPVFAIIPPTEGQTSLLTVAL